MWDIGEIFVGYSGFTVTMCVSMRLRVRIYTCVCECVHVTSPVDKGSLSGP